MVSPLSLTCEVLASTRNRAAGAVLMAALNHRTDDSLPDILKAIVSRRGKTEHLAVIQQWHVLSAESQSIVLTNPERLGSALRDAVLAEDDQIFTNACEIIDQSSQFELTPSLVSVAESTTVERADAATDLVLNLVYRFGELLADPNPKLGNHSPQHLRSLVLDSLERSLARYRNHKRERLVEAYVCLSGTESALISEILDDPHHQCFLPLSKVISTSGHPAVRELLLSFLLHDAIPPAVVNAISHRTDRELVLELLDFRARYGSTQLDRNLKRVRSFAWLGKKGVKLSQLDETRQVQVVNLLTATSVPSAAQFPALEEVFQSGQPRARAVACQALAAMSGSHVDRLILAAAMDESPLVQVVAARQLRERHIPGTMPLILSLLDSPHEEVRQAAREGLSEFCFENFVKTFDQLSEEARLTSGHLMKRVDGSYLTKLAEEFAATSVKRRLRAIDISRCSGLVPQNKAHLTALLEDIEHVVRSAAQEALATLPKTQPGTAKQGGQSVVGALANLGTSGVVLPTEVSL